MIVKLLDQNGKNVGEKAINVSLQPYVRSDIPISILLLSKAGGYLLVAEFTSEGADHPVISRRFIKIGVVPEYKYFDMHIQYLRIVL